MTVRNGAGEMMLASLFLYVPVLIFEMVVEGLAGSLRAVRVSASGIWPSKRDTDIGAVLSESQPISKSDPHQYDVGYEAAASIALRRSLSDLHTALRRFTPLAKSEFDWGAVDAMADELRKRNGQSPVL